MPIVNYDWDEFEDNVAEEYDENGDTIAEYTTEPEQYGNLISQKRDGTTSVYHSDGQGSTLALTDDSGAVTDTYDYNAFGETTAQTGTTVNPYRYIGQKGYQYDEETDDYYVRERIYGPTIARWKSPDPLGFIDGMNLYNYGDNNPIVFIDPTGLWTMITESLYESDCYDELEDLADIVSGDRRDWVCIWPTNNPETAGTTREDWDLYPTARPGARARVSNLLGLNSTQLKMMAKKERADSYLRAVRIMLSNDRRGGATKDWVSGRSAAGIIRRISKQGSTPIDWMVVGAHCNGGIQVGDSQGNRLFQSRDLFTVADEKDNSQNSLDSAINLHGPPRCWFTRNSNIYGVGCNTNVWARDWASNILRTNSSAHGTTNFVFGVWGPGNTNPQLWITSNVMTGNPRVSRTIARNLVQALALQPGWMVVRGNQ